MKCKIFINNIILSRYKNLCYKTKFKFLFSYLFFFLSQIVKCLIPEEQNKFYYEWKENE